MKKRIALINIDRAGVSHLDINTYYMTALNERGELILIVPVESDDKLERIKHLKEHTIIVDERRNSNKGSLTRVLKQDAYKYQSYYKNSLGYYYAFSSDKIVN